MVSSFNTKSSGYRNCKYCQEAGCLFCNSERKKAEGAQQAAEQQRTERLKAMTPEEILNELPAIRNAIELSSALSGTRLTAEELEQQARSQVLENLDRGGHEYPMPQPIFTCDGSKKQFAEMRQVFHFDRLQEAVALGSQGFAAISQHAKAVMASRQTQVVTLEDLLSNQSKISAFCWQQAWAAALFYAGKNIDNRPNCTHKRGDVLVYATVGKQQLQKSLNTMHDRGLRLPEGTQLIHGALLGVVEIHDCTDNTQSDDWIGDWGMPRSWHWHVRNPRMFTQPIPYRTKAQGWFFVTAESISLQQQAGVTYTETRYACPADQ